VEKTKDEITEAKHDIVLAFERIASALEGLHEELQCAGNRYWPQPKEQKEAILGRVLTEEERIKKDRGNSDKIPIEEWLTNLGEHDDEEEGVVGDRSRQWIKDHPPEKKTDNASAEVSTGKSSMGSGRTEKRKA
jgi:hypothetical protein